MVCDLQHRFSRARDIENCRDCNFWGWEDTAGGFSSCAPQRGEEKIKISKPERTLRDEDEEQERRRRQWRNNDDRVDSLNLGVMLAYLPGPSGHHNLFEWASAIVALVGR